MLIFVLMESSTEVTRGHFEVTAISLNPQHKLTPCVALDPPSILGGSGKGYLGVKGHFGVKSYFFMESSTEGSKVILRSRQYL